MASSPVSSNLSGVEDKSKMQTIYLTDIRRFAQLIDSYTVLLRPERQKKMLSYSLLDDRLRCLAGGILLEQAAEGREICFTAKGKPFLPDGPHLSLAHSGNYVCLAVCVSGPVGIDIEEQRDVNYSDLGKTAFHQAEYDFLMQEPGAGRFYDLWTLKESYVKMIGSGFSIEPSSFCVLPDKHILPEGIPFMQNFNFIKGYSLALCAMEPIEARITVYQG